MPIRDGLETGSLPAALLSQVAWGEVWSRCVHLLHAVCAPSQPLPPPKFGRDAKQICWCLQAPPFPLPAASDCPEHTLLGPLFQLHNIFQPDVKIFSKYKWILFAERENVWRPRSSWGQMHGLDQRPQPELPQHWDTVRPGDWVAGAVYWSSEVGEMVGLRNTPPVSAIENKGGQFTDC